MIDENPAHEHCGNSTTTNTERKMMEPTIIDFVGYVLKSNPHLLPMYSCVYGVYRCHYSHARDEISIIELIYIGETDNLYKRVYSGHEKTYNWENTLDLGSDEKLCFNYTPIDDADFRKQVEAAMIFKHRPRCNVLDVQSYNYPKIWIKTSGENEDMHDSFMVP